MYQRIHVHDTTPHVPKSVYDAGAQKSSEGVQEGEAAFEHGPRKERYVPVQHDRCMVEEIVL